MNRAQLNPRGKGVALAGLVGAPATVLLMGGFSTVWWMALTVLSLVVLKDLVAEVGHRMTIYKLASTVSRVTEMGVDEAMRTKRAATAARLASQLSHAQDGLSS